MQTHTTTEVTEIPLCDLCGDVDIERPAVADAQLPRHGSWGNLCLEHFVNHGCQVGLGKGQQYIMATN